MILHRLNAEESEAFINDTLDDRNTLADIEKNIENDMILRIIDESNTEKKFVVDIPNQNFKFKSKDGIIDDAPFEDVPKLVELLRQKKDKFPKYYRKFNEKDKSAVLYLIKNGEKKTKPANAASNKEGQLENIVKVAEKFEKEGGKNILKKDFTHVVPPDIDNEKKKKYYSKATFLDVLEYSTRHYGYYVHPMTMK